MPHTQPNARVEYEEVPTLVPSLANPKSQYAAVVILPKQSLAHSNMYSSDQNQPLPMTPSALFLSNSRSRPYAQDFRVTLPSWCDSLYIRYWRSTSGLYISESADTSNLMETYQAGGYNLIAAFGCTLPGARLGCCSAAARSFDSDSSSKT